jgi:hypothetical protein
VCSILFIFYSRNTGHSFWVYWAPCLLAGVAMLAGIPVYRAARSHMTAGTRADTSRRAARAADRARRPSAGGEAE